MSAHVHSDEIRGPMWLIGVMMVLALAVTSAWRWIDGPVHDADPPTAAVRALHFADLPDGSIDVIDAATGARIDVLSGEQGFVRGALRSLVRGRRQHEAGPREPFLLQARVDGRLTLSDPVTGQRIDLEAFGPTNLAAFARLLRLPAPSRGDGTGLAAQAPDR